MWNRYQNKISVVVVLVILLNLFIFDLSSAAIGDEADFQKIKEQIAERQKKMAELDRQQRVYEETLKIKRQQISSLKNQLSILQDSMLKMELQLKSTKLELETTNLEIQDVQIQIKQQESKIVSQQIKLAGAIQAIDQNQRKSNYLEILAVSGKLADFFQGASQLRKLSTGLSSALQELKNLRGELTEKSNLLNSRQQQLNNLQNRIASYQDRLSLTSATKSDLLSQTKNQEGKFQALLIAAKREQAQINADIQDLEVQARRKLSQGNNSLPSDSGFIWPITSRIITAYFHDPDYPYRNIFEHPAVDIATGHGTAIRAARSGYVARVQYDGTTKYAYIMLVHSGGISTVYGHISKPLVKEDSYVVQGETIALSGATRGTVGAGNLTTGPHLHFEVRLNGIPVDPLQYLP